MFHTESQYSYDCFLDRLIKLKVVKDNEENIIYIVSRFEKNDTKCQKKMKIYKV